jgi:hypothetical protein
MAMVKNGLMRLRSSRTFIAEMLMALLLAQLTLAVSCGRACSQELRIVVAEKPTLRARAMNGLRLDVQTKWQGAQFASALMVTEDIVACKEGGSLF